MKTIVSLAALCLAAAPLGASAESAPGALSPPPDAAPAASASDERARVGLFAGFEWRGMVMAGRAAHGPGVQAGVVLFGGHLKLGLGGILRPGPINPATFEVEAAGGRTYRGSSRLRLRSDGGTFGLLIAPVFDLPGTSAVSVELPVVIGQGAYGFYLTGKDRQTPDGRRVSAWENELLDERDASVGLGLDAGVRLAWKRPSTPWVRPYVGVHYTTVVGFDSYVKSSYGGPSVALGVQFGRF